MDTEELGTFANHNRRFSHLPSVSKHIFLLIILELKQVSLVIKEIKMVWIVGFKDGVAQMAIQKTTILKDRRHCRRQVARPTGDGHQWCQNSGHWNSGAVGIYR